VRVEVVQAKGQAGKSTADVADDAKNCR